MFKENLLFLEEIKNLAGLNEDERVLIASHKRIKKAQLTVDGESYEAWRIVHNDALGPGKGGIRFHPETNEEEVKSLAFCMSLKNSLAGLPYGGAKGGVKFDPKNVTPEKLEKISRAYVDAFFDYLGEDLDVPAPDVYTDSQIMAWMLDQYEKRLGRHQPAMITGKPLELGGCALRASATARGGFMVTEKVLAALGLKKEELKVAIQGFGNAGAVFAEMLFNDGFKIVAVSDSQGGIWQESGLDIAALKKVKQEQGTVAAYPNGQKISNEELLTLGVDVLVLAALGGAINENNQAAIKAKYIIELANGPITAQADRYLFEQKILVAPDILANAGGVVVSYFEWAQNKSGQIFSDEYLDNWLAQILTKAWQGVYDLYQKKSGAISWRQAAYFIALKRIVAAEKLRGNLKK